MAMHGEEGDLDRRGHRTGRRREALRRLRGGDGVNIAIERGEFFSLLGPSGCGKTTTLRMIAGFEQPTAGEIRLEGEDVSQVPPYRRNVNTVFQHYALFPHMSIADNVAFGPRSAKLDKEETTARVGEMLEVVRLADFAQRKPGQLCGGQQQRVALARALVNYPERAAPRRAARRPGPEAAPGHAAGAQAHPARGRDHLRLRDPRSGRGAHHERPDRGDERGPGRADRRSHRHLRRPGHGVRGRVHRAGQPVAGDGDCTVQRHGDGEALGASLPARAIGGLAVRT